MSMWAQFWQPSTGYVEGSLPPRFEKAAVRPIYCCGSDGIIKLSGQRKNVGAVHVAREECRRRKWIGFTLIRGSSLLNARTVRKYEEVSPCTVS